MTFSRGESGELVVTSPAGYEAIVFATSQYWDLRSDLQRPVIPSYSPTIEVLGTQLVNEYLNGMDRINAQGLDANQVSPFAFTPPGMVVTPTDVPVVIESMVLGVSYVKADAVLEDYPYETRARITYADAMQANLDHLVGLYPEHRGTYELMSEISAFPVIPEVWPAGFDQFR